MTGNPVLLVALEAAVPLWIVELRRMPAGQRERTRTVWARAGAESIAHKGDVLQYGSKRRGEAADVFSHLARGLAALAFQPGGVTFAGLHFEATADANPDEPPGRPGRPIVDAVRSL